MPIAYFVYFQNSEDPQARVSDPDYQSISEIVRRTPRMLRAHLFTPEVVGGPFKDDGYPPQFALQLYFAELPELEAAIAPQGHLQALAAPGQLRSLEGAVVTQQAMVARGFPTSSPLNQSNVEDLRCSYLVHYPGQAQNLNAWLNYYLSHHPQLMRNLPGVREIEIYTRVDWCDSMPWERVHHMQRNKLVFDSAQALDASFGSSALHAMRDDFKKFPPFVGGNVHYPMITSTIVGDPGARVSGR